MKQLFFILLTIILLSGCTNHKQIEVIAKHVDKPKLVLPNADVLYLKKTEWTLITEDNIMEAFDELRKDGRPIVFFGVSDEGYENLSTNFSSIRAYLQQQNAIIQAYKNYYTKSEQVIDAANTEIEKVNKEVKKVNTEATKDESWWDSFTSKFKSTTKDISKDIPK